MSANIVHGDLKNGKVHNFTNLALSGSDKSDSPNDSNFPDSSAEALGVTEQNENSDWEKLNNEMKNDYQNTVNGDKYKSGDNCNDNCGNHIERERTSSCSPSQNELTDEKISENKISFNQCENSKDSCLSKPLNSNALCALLEYGDSSSSEEGGDDGCIDEEISLNIKPPSDNIIAHKINNVVCSSSDERIDSIDEEISPNIRPPSDNFNAHENINVKSCDDPRIIQNNETSPLSNSLATFSQSQPRDDCDSDEDEDDDVLSMSSSSSSSISTSLVFSENSDY